MLKKLIFTYVLLIIMMSCAQRTYKYTYPEVGNGPIKNTDRFHKTLHQYVDNEQIAGIQTAILKDNQIVHFDSYGYANIERKTHLNDSSIFRIFSMTKPITSVALMQLYEHNKFKLEDPVNRYIPEFKSMTVYNEENDIVVAKNDITIIDLLRHSSGISYGYSRNDSLNQAYSKARLGHSKSLKDFIKNLSQLPLAFEPGTDYEYGYSTDVCGYLIEVLSGKSVDQYIQENILNPLQMKDTHFQLPKDKVNYFTTGYRPGENDSLVVAELPETSRFLNTPKFVSAGGGLVSTTSDYLNFCKMLLNNGSLFGHQIIKPGTLELILADHLHSVRAHTPHLRLLDGETGFGLGFSIKKRKNGSATYGWGGAAGTYFRIEPQRDLAYVMMIQLSPYRHLGLSEEFQNLVNEAF